MAVVSAQLPEFAGIELALVAASVAGDSFANSGRQFMVVKNGNAASRTLTFDSPDTCDFGLNGAGHDLAVVCLGNVAVPKITVIGPFMPAKFNDANARVQVTYDAVTDLTVAVITF